ncbi:hypothetical protein I312_104347 [Cryptococcus bacillisporus CA1280]|uniref:Uncharacterized protein n=1 Tax=Cryptococcus bacillisporus CA1280 TaxID=1296109 RepID=A0A0D0TK89_CRYGA|nr:hypothetical protein I312_03775 [Cryptococcus bacillisporus CA1280]
MAHHHFVGINPAGLSFSHPTPPADHPAPPSSGSIHTPANFASIQEPITDPNAVAARRRGRPSTRGEAGVTPPPEIGWWEDRAPSWHKDAMQGGKSSMEFLMEWSEEMKNQGHYYWMGVRDGGNLHQGASRFRDYLYAQHGPIRRSSKAIRNKVENIKQKFFEAQEWLKDPNGDHTTMTIPDVEKKLNKICRNYRFWETIFVELPPVDHEAGQNAEGSSSNQTLQSASQSAVRQGSGPLIRGIPVPETAQAAVDDAQRNVRRRLNDGSAAPIPPDASLVGRVLPASYLERTREEREREKHELAKKQQALSREQYELEQKRDERDQKRFEWEQTKHLVETALKIRELDIIPLEAAMIKARALYGQARDEDQAEATL